MQRVQSVQNTTARLATGARRSDHITPVLRQLHWQPVRQRVDFKVIELVFQSLTDQAPVYLPDDCRLVSDSDGRQLRSANIRRVRCHRREIVAVTEVSLSPTHACGTLSHQHSGKLMPVLTASNDFERRTCLVSVIRPRRLVTFCFVAPYKFSLSMYVCSGRSWRQRNFCRLCCGFYTGGFITDVVMSAVLSFVSGH